jgi:hypothetical protein
MLFLLISLAPAHNDVCMIFFIVDVNELLKLNEILYVNVFITILIYSVYNQTWVY